MSTENNVVSFEHAVNASITQAIIDNLKNRAGRWVAEPFLVTVANTTNNPSLPIMEVINEMVTNGTLEKQYVPLQDKMHRTMHAAMYRLIPEPW